MSQVFPQPSPSPRKASATRSPPVLPSGMPVRAHQTKQQQQQQQQFSQPSPHRHHPHLHQQPSHHKMSMPSPGPSPKTTHVDQHKGRTGLPRPHHHAASVSSRPSSNPSGGSSNDSSLRETSRTNIRGSMPPPSTARQTSATLGWGDNIKSPSPKEQWLETPKDSWTPQVQVEVRDEVEMQFDSLLDSLQVPATVRQKFSSVSQDVKSSILHSTITFNPTILSSLGLPIPQASKETPKMKKRISTPLLRKAKSSSSLNSPNQSPARVGKTYSVEGEGFVIVASPVSSPNIGAGGPMSPPPHIPHRGQSMDMPRPASMRMSTGPNSSSRPMSMSLFGPSSSNGSMSSLGKNGGKGLGISMGEQPDAFIQWLSSYRGTDLKMDVARCKKLRMLLRHETTAWVGAFVEMGGYKLVLDRMKDLLDIEWREEQHDDQMLYELLRCVKALSTSEIGKAALRAHFPNPFTALSTLLFSEKKPGDLPTRQIIVELWLFLFELFPPIASRTPGGRPTSVRFDEKPPVDIAKEVRGLLVPDLPDPTKDHHEFVTKAHRPRVFKAWVGELSDICRDYFWIMCHGSNTLWTLDEVDDTKVEKPVAPGGATGGVEFEAMNYVTTHFKLLNAFCKQQAIEDREKALQLHQDLMSSGMDRILVTFRKASTTYYPAVHLELARYVSLLQAASPGGKLPYLISKMVGPPPEELRKFGGAREWLPMPVPVGQNGGRRGGWDGRQ
ncbi:hypothetical protein CI109_101967 [Kwoniella shandongensis]|uniref:Uncharacterized protein n=1 Tax=Kwoniella shandongensis TaxID=1734106 RepID=A0A5M6BZ43_9TREE|nr:uncharacterized protein CI109_005373 [Kwoniella shandongensis]KAA5526249.1 hypothetical protein CI109_005373 [Kwoniella shandongensis]